MKSRKTNITSGLKRSNGDWIVFNRHGEKVKISRCSYAASDEWFIQSAETAGRMSEEHCRQFPTLRAAIEHTEGFWI